ncbi:hypothetical protein ACQEU8_18960 [Streptomyces sp. CA-250714]|uniref:hypothetical protein n=1 Tax=Streptomyces sp. CA-250714 TaxID=3240060 RepID=UPI003D89F5ED
MRTAATYRGHPVYDGQGLKAIEGLAAAVEAGRTGQQLLRAEVAEQLGVRAVDVRHLDRVAATSHPPATSSAVSWGCGGSGLGVSRNDGPLAW